MSNSLRERDHRHLWHPYTNIDAFESGTYTAFERAEGVHLYDLTGRTVLDGISSWWSTALGHSHPSVVEAIQKQAGVLQQSILGNLSHPIAVELAERLAQLCPGSLNHVYFAADGASATEAAMKMAIQYWWNQGESGRTRFVALEEGYHGDTLGAVGAGFVPAFHAPFEDVVVRAFAAPTPHCKSSDAEESEAYALKAFEAMAAIVREHHAQLAGVILEPLCQGAAGIWIYPAEYLRRVRALCDEFGLPLIADEIAVGFGRTGEIFACERAGIVPDIICVGKALTAGYLPMSASIATDEIYDTFRNHDDARDRTFYDGHTYCGNPITGAAALAAIDVYTSEDVFNASKPAAETLRKAFAEIDSYDVVDYQKTLGLIGMCAFSAEAGGGAYAKRVAANAMELGLFVRPLGSSLYLWPPLVVTPDELAQMIALFKQAIEQTPAD